MTEQEQHPEVTAPEHKRQETISNQALVDRINRSDRWMIALTAVIAGGGIISAIIFGWQLSVMQGQLNEMQVEQRAWIGAPKINISPIDTKELSDATKFVRVTATFSNIGKSPALVYMGAEIVDAKITSICVKMHREFATQKRDNPKNPGFYILPADNLPVSNFPDGNDFSNISIARIRGLKSPYVNGCVVYDDGADDLPHQTGFWAAINKADLSVPDDSSREVK